PTRSTTRFRTAVLDRRASAKSSRVRLAGSRGVPVVGGSLVEWPAHPPLAFRRAASAAAPASPAALLTQRTELSCGKATRSAPRKLPAASSWLLLQVASRKVIARDVLVRAKLLQLDLRPVAGLNVAGLQTHRLPLPACLVHQLNVLVSRRLQQL